MSDKQPTAKELLEQACQSPEKLLSYLEETARKHLHYKCYTKYAFLKNWIEEKGLFLDVGDGWNDVEDRERFIAANPDGTNFGKCFTFSKSENVAMWMLYGGLHQSGVMIDYAAMELHELVDSIKEVELGYWNGDRFECKEVLHEGEFTPIFTDMLYCAREENGQYTVKRSDARCEHVPTSCIQELGWRQKSFPWAYENECRLLISVNRKFGKEIKTACIRAEKLYRATEQKERIYRAPNSIRSEFKPSTLQARMDWTLCDNKCMNKFHVK